MTTPTTTTTTTDAASVSLSPPAALFRSARNAIAQCLRLAWQVQAQPEFDRLPEPERWARLERALWGHIGYPDRPSAMEAIRAAACDTGRDATDLILAAAACDAVLSAARAAAAEQYPRSAPAAAAAGSGATP